MSMENHQDNEEQIQEFKVNLLDTGLTSRSTRKSINLISMSADGNKHINIFCKDKVSIRNYGTEKDDTIDAKNITLQTTQHDIFIAFTDKNNQQYKLNLKDKQLKEILMPYIGKNRKIPFKDFYTLHDTINDALKKALIVGEPKITIAGNLEAKIEIELSDSGNPCITYDPNSDTITYNGYHEKWTGYLSKQANANVGECTFDNEGNVTVSFIIDGEDTKTTLFQQKINHSAEFRKIFDKVSEDKDSNKISIRDIYEYLAKKQSEEINSSHINNSLMEQSEQSEEINSSHINNNLMEQSDNNKEENNPFGDNENTGLDKEYQFNKGESKISVNFNNEINRNRSKNIVVNFNNTMLIKNNDLNNQNPFGDNESDNENNNFENPFGDNENNNLMEQQANNQEENSKNDNINNEENNDEDLFTGDDISYVLEHNNANETDIIIKIHDNDDDEAITFGSKNGKHFLWHNNKKKMISIKTVAISPNEDNETKKNYPYQIEFGCDEGKVYGTPISKKVFDKISRAGQHSEFIIYDNGFSTEFKKFLDMFTSVDVKKPQIVENQKTMTIYLSKNNDPENDPKIVYDYENHETYYIDALGNQSKLENVSFDFKKNNINLVVDNNVVQSIPIQTIDPDVQQIFQDCIDVFNKDNHLEAISRYCIFNQILESNKKQEKELLSTEINDIKRTDNNKIFITDGGKNMIIYDIKDQTFKSIHTETIAESKMPKVISGNACFFYKNNTLYLYNTQDQKYISLTIPDDLLPKFNNNLNKDNKLHPIDLVKCLMNEKNNEEREKSETRIKYRPKIVKLSKEKSKNENENNENSEESSISDSKNEEENKNTYFDLTPKITNKRYSGLNIYKTDTMNFNSNPANQKEPIEYKEAQSLSIIGNFNELMFHFDDRYDDNVFWIPIQDFIFGNLAEFRCYYNNDVYHITYYDDALVLESKNNPNASPIIIDFKQMLQKQNLDTKRYPDLDDMKSFLIRIKAAEKKQQAQEQKEQLKQDNDYFFDVENDIISTIYSNGKNIRKAAAYMHLNDYINEYANQEMTENEINFFIDIFGSLNNEDALADIIDNQIKANQQANDQNVDFNKIFIALMYIQSQERLSKFTNVFIEKYKEAIRDKNYNDHELINMNAVYSYYILNNAPRSLDDNVDEKYRPKIFQDIDEAEQKEQSNKEEQPVEYEYTGNPDDTSLETGVKDDDLTDILKKSAGLKNDEDDKYHDLTDFRDKQKKSYYNNDINNGSGFKEYNRKTFTAINNYRNNNEPMMTKNLQFNPKNKYNYNLNLTLERVKENEQINKNNNDTKIETRPTVVAKPIFLNTVHKIYNTNGREIKNTTNNLNPSETQTSSKSQNYYI